MKYLSVFANRPFLLPVFIGLILTYFFLVNFDLTLSHIPGEMLGSATLNGVDIAKRVNLLYYALGILTISWLIFQFLINAFFNEIEKYLPDNQLINYLSFFGILIVLSSFFLPGASSSLNIFLTILLLAFLFFFLAGTTSLSRSSAENLFYSIILLAGSFAYFLRDIQIIYLNSTGKFYLNEYLLITGFLLIFSTIIFNRTEISQKIFRQITFVFSAIPFVSFLTREATMILAERFELLVDLSVIYPVCLLVCIIALSIVLYRNKDYFHKQINLLRIGGVIFFLGLITFSYYSSVVEQPTDMFEIANSALGIQRFFYYDEIPILETFNSHVLFEIFAGYFYSFVNGYHGLDFLVYNFLHAILFFGISYLFLKKWIRNPFLVMAILLFVPFVPLMIPSSFEVMLLVPFILERHFKNANFMSYLALALVSILLILWKIDFGYASVISIIAISLILHFSGNLKINYLQALKAVILLSIPFVIIALWAVFNEIPLLNNFQQALHYISSQQTYGRPELAMEYDNLFYVHHLIFPLLIWTLLVILLFNLKNLLATNRFEVLSLLFLIFFYLLNYHRGIVRHGFFENNDRYLSSFVFLILPLSIYLLKFSEKWKPYRNYFFLLSAFVLLMAFKFPSFEMETSPLSQVIEKFAQADTTWKNGMVASNRIIGADDFHKDEIAELEQFFNEYLRDGETFYDYSNSPMLYFYLEKRVPSYFNQMLLSMHDEFLQDQIIDSLENSRIPFVVHSNFPAGWYDYQDQGPIDLPPYPLAEYLHQKYRPFAIVNKHVIWSKNDLDASVQTAPVNFHVDTLKDHMKLIFNPTESDFSKFEILIHSKEVVSIEVNDSVYYGNYGIDSLKHFLFDKSEVSTGRLKISGNLDSIKSITMINCNFFIDQYSYSPQFHNLIELPKIWVDSYNEDAFEKMQLNFVDDTIPGFQFELPPGIDKSNGNFLLIEGYSPWEKRVECSVNLTSGESILGTYKFNLNDKKENNGYLIRVSAQYLWNEDRVDMLQILPEFYLSEITAAYILTPKVNSRKTLE